MSVSSWSGARGLQTLPCLKYYNKSRFTLGLNAAKNKNNVALKNASNKSC